MDTNKSSETNTSMQIDCNLQKDIIELLSEYKCILHYNNKKNNYATHIEDYQINQIDEVLNRLCSHEWIDDTVDDCFGYSRNIKYCSKCQITKK